MRSVQVLLFAGARDAVGQDSVEVEIGDAATFAELATALEQAYPALAPFVPAAKFASDASYMAAGDAVDPSAELALIPPVSGG